MDTLKSLSSNRGGIVVWEPTETSKQPIRARYLGHVTGYQPIRDQYFLIRSIPGDNTTGSKEIFENHSQIYQTVIMHTHTQTHSQCTIGQRDLLFNFRPEWHGEI
eukprot:sb/3477959/